MAIVKETIERYQCERCDHKWRPRKFNLQSDKNEQPHICPACKSPYWNKPRVHKAPK